MNCDTIPHGEAFLCQNSSLTQADFEKAEDGDLLEYAVYRECLVYLVKCCGQLRACILASHNSVIGNHDDALHVSKGVYPIPRKATAEDFAEFRVSMPATGI